MPLISAQKCPTAPASQMLCSASYGSNFCYVLQSSPLSWGAARSKCTLMGGDIYAPASAAEDAAVTAYFGSIKRWAAAPAGRRVLHQPAPRRPPSAAAARLARPAPGCAPVPGTRAASGDSLSPPQRAAARAVQIFSAAVCQRHQPPCCPGRRSYWIGVAKAPNSPAYSRMDGRPLLQSQPSVQSTNYAKWWAALPGCLAGCGSHSQCRLAWDLDQPGGNLLLPGCPKCRCAPDMQVPRLRCQG
jgi:hypothetical protein